MADINYSSQHIGKDYVQYSFYFDSSVPADQFDSRGNATIFVALPPVENNLVFPGRLPEPDRISAIAIDWRVRGFGSYILPSGTFNFLWKEDWISSQFATLNIGGVDYKSPTFPFVMLPGSNKFKYIFPFSKNLKNVTFGSVILHAQTFDNSVASEAGAALPTSANISLAINCYLLFNQ